MQPPARPICHCRFALFGASPKGIPARLSRVSATQDEEGRPEIGSR